MLDTKIEKLKKLLELTSSTNDNEALVAMRKANEILKNSGKTWSSVLNSDLAEANSRYDQLHVKFNALLNDHKVLIASYNKLIAQRQVVLLPVVSQRRTYRRRF